MSTFTQPLSVGPVSVSCWPKASLSSWPCASQWNSSLHGPWLVDEQAAVAEAATASLSPAQSCWPIPVNRCHSVVTAPPGRVLWCGPRMGLNGGSRTACHTWSGNTHRYGDPHGAPTCNPVTDTVIHPEDASVRPLHPKIHAQVCAQST